ncbi:hypothetical protein F7725_004674 [Dissostichus mawsoni]|uniref:Uncharacterized protein n=1 Tax=Dissostichus mawsoni TaxID=36200 RepID=A0A7J5XJQ9_DISMA|nr:hypothetical protein F7725_004674 [Dissostichus mawsoni]
MALWTHLQTCSSSSTLSMGECVLCIRCSFCFTRSTSRLSGMPVRTPSRSMATSPFRRIMFWASRWLLLSWVCNATRAFSRWDLRGRSTQENMARSRARVSIGGSSSPLSSRQHLAWDRKRRRPCSICTEVTRAEEVDEGEEARDLSTSLCARRKSCTMPPKVERRSLDSSSTRRVSRLSGAKKHTNASLMRCSPPRPRERTSGGRW